MLENGNTKKWNNRMGVYYKKSIESKETFTFFNRKTILIHNFDSFFMVLIYKIEIYIMQCVYFLK